MIYALPDITARKGYQGRALVQKATLESFVSAFNTEEDVSKFTKGRMLLERHFSLKPSDMEGL